MDGSKIAPPASFEGRPLVDLDEQEPVEEQVDLGAGDRPFAEQRAFGQAGRAGGNPLIPGWRRPGTARRRPGRGRPAPVRRRLPAGLSCSVDRQIQSLYRIRALLRVSRPDEMAAACS
jgi:hypothetical protein